MILRNKYKVLLSNGNYKQTLGAARCLALSGFEVHVIGSKICLCKLSRYVSKIVFNQKELSDENIVKFINFLSMEDYDVFLPVSAKAVQLAAKFKEDINRFCKVPIPAIEKVSICLDKAATYDFAEKIGIQVPKTWMFNSRKELEDNLNNIHFPIVIKDRHEISKVRPIYVNNQDELLETINSFETIVNYKKDSFPLLQQYIDGIGCGFFALYQQGECKRVFMHRRIRETPPSGGASCCAESIYESDLKDYGKKLLDALSWHGVAMVEFKRQKDTNQLYLMEINPKFWGSLDIALASGAIFPVWAALMELGEDMPYLEEYRRGLKFHWPFEGEITHLFENPRAFNEVLLDFINPKVKSNLWLTDPLPCLFSILVEARSILNHLN
jgi:predicted ATP-grasp superfamily ATP-dependent carboligase